MFTPHLFHNESNFPITFHMGFYIWDDYMINDAAASPTPPTPTPRVGMALSDQIEWNMLAHHTTPSHVLGPLISCASNWFKLLPIVAQINTQRQIV